MPIKIGATYLVLVPDQERLDECKEPRWAPRAKGVAVQTRLLGGFDAKLRMESTGLLLHFYHYEIEEVTSGP